MVSVLISGASVAGPALAYWLHRYGFAVTVVEKAGALRGGGYPIDIRGTAVDVIERMGALPAVRAAHINTGRITAVDPAGRVVASVSSEVLTAAEAGRDLELPRGELAAILHDLTRSDIEYVFSDSISALDESGDRVRVSFERGEPRDFDVVVGADGLHSRTRRLAFGPEAGFYRDLSHRFVGFSAPNDSGLRSEALLQNAPGRLAAIYAVGESPVVQVLLAYRGPERDVAEVFAGLGGRVPGLLAELRKADDVYADAVAQIRMPGWSAGRVALVGDAAYAPSFFSGQGTSLALTGAYVLAGELARARGDHRSALAAYQRTVRDYVERNQALAFTGMRTVVPSTRRDLWVRNTGLRAAPLLARFGLLSRLSGDGPAAATALALPAYPLMPENGQ